MATAPKPYWIDDYQGSRHEAYSYGDLDSHVLSVEHDGRSLRLLFPETVPPTAIRMTAVSPSGDLLFLVGEELDDEDYEGGVIEGGDAVSMIARRHPTRENTYWILARHNLYPELLDHLEEPPNGKPALRSEINSWEN
jgi:hypothetical protein